MIQHLVPCNVCKDTDTGIPLGYVRSVDTTFHGQKTDSIYNTTVTCPACNGEKYFYEDID